MKNIVLSIAFLGGMLSGTSLLAHTNSMLPQTKQHPAQCIQGKLKGSIQGDQASCPPCNSDQVCCCIDGCGSSNCACQNTCNEQ